MSFTLINETKEKIPQVEFEAIKNEILGPDYILNVIITTSENIKKLNTIYRNKEHATDILSFPLSDSEGEIYISTKETREEAKKFDRTYENFFPFLFIHGCTHLKGHDHGAIMEGIEVKVRNKFGI
ncbi:MAG TPA: rRNA maturation RNase YbeY [Candidatus Paceibacterota bacterium]|jgi:probable rRNA maturation factor|nr:rRNA maturation RNase YbeY [Candidatus Paceibacterota bacterium]